MITETYIYIYTLSENVSRMHALTSLLNHTNLIDFLWGTPLYELIKKVDPSDTTFNTILFHLLNEHQLAIMSLNGGYISKRSFIKVLCGISLFSDICY